MYGRVKRDKENVWEIPFGSGVPENFRVINSPIFFSILNKTFHWIYFFISILNYISDWLTKLSQKLLWKNVWPIETVLQNFELVYVYVREKGDNSLIDIHGTVKYVSDCFSFNVITINLNCLVLEYSAFAHWCSDHFLC